MKNNIKFIAIIFSLLMCFSCKNKDDYSKIKNKVPISHNTNDIHKIVINKFEDAKDYTYLNINENENQYWLAIPKTAVKKGETYYYKGGMVMNNFKSKQLNRTFKSIIFVQEITTSEDQLKSQSKNPHAKSEIGKTEKIKIEVPKDGISIKDLFSNVQNFSNKSILIKGKVVKVNNAILNTNWVHIIDGTEFKTNKSLTISTKESVKVGDIVTFKGIVILNKDFGKGYIYPVLIEKGKLIK